MFQNRSNLISCKNFQHWLLWLNMQGQQRPQHWQAYKGEKKGIRKQKTKVTLWIRKWYRVVIFITSQNKIKTMGLQLKIGWWSQPGRVQGRVFCGWREMGLSRIPQYTLKIATLGGKWYQPFQWNSRNNCLASQHCVVGAKRESKNSRKRWYL